MPKINWRHDRKRLVLPISIFPSSTAANPHEYALITGLLDTGATGTGIRQDVASRLGLEKRGRRQVFTANGDILANEHLIRVGFYPGVFSEYPFDIKTTLPFVLEKELLAYSLHPNFSFEMIVGMDIIAQADLLLMRNGGATLRLS